MVVAWSGCEWSEVVTRESVHSMSLSELVISVAVMCRNEWRVMRRRPTFLVASVATLAVAVVTLVVSART